MDLDKIEERLRGVEQDAAVIKATMATKADFANQRMVMIVGFVILAFLSDGGIGLLRLLMSFAPK